MKNFLVFTAGSVAGFVALPAVMIYVPVIQKAIIRKCATLYVTTVPEEVLRETIIEFRDKIDNFLKEHPEDVK